MNMIEPEVIDKAVKTLISGAAERVVPALETAIKQALDGLEIEITVKVRAKP